MTRAFAIALLVATFLFSADLFAQSASTPPESAKKQLGNPPEEPPEEDKDYQVKEYTLNPVQSEKEFSIGKDQWRAGKPRYALGRFVEAFKWDPGNYEALYWIGVARDKIGEAQGAREAFQQYLKENPKGERVKDVKKRLDRSAK